MADDQPPRMSGQESTQTDPLICRRCAYATEVLRTSCPHCGGDMIYEPES